MTATSALTDEPKFTVFPGGQPALIGLARVSTDSQDLRLQMDALEEAGCARAYPDKVSSRKDAKDRPGLQAALDYLRSGDTLAVWKLDRLGRSVKEVLIIADDLHARGVGLKILTGRLAGQYQPTGEGKFFFTMMAAFAELERDIITERTMAGLRASVKPKGRQPVLDAGQIADARDMRDQGLLAQDIARRLVIKTGVNAGKHPSRTAVYRYLQETS